MTPERKQLDIQKEAICLSLSMGMLHTRRRVNSNMIETDADLQMVHVAKDIFESQELKAIGQFQGVVKSYIRARCLPSPFRTGVHLISLQLIAEVMEQMTAYEQQYQALVETFMEFYAGIYAQRHDPNFEMREKLGSLYRAEDYPDPRRVRLGFRFEVQLWELGTPGALRSIDRALYEREAAKMQSVWAEAQQQITQVLFTEVRDMTARMAERLTPGPDGKPKVFRDTLVGNLQEWLDLFEKRDLAKDEQLIAYVQQIRTMISGINPGMLRDSDSLRKDIGKEMKKITKQLDQAIVERPGRMINLEEGEEVTA